MARSKTPPHKNLVTEALHLVDSKGRIRARLTTGPTDGMPRSGLSDNDGRERIVIALGKNGAPYVSLLREDGAAAADIGLSETGHASVEVWGADGRSLARLGVNPPF